MLTPAFARPRNTAHSPPLLSGRNAAEDRERDCICYESKNRISRQNLKIRSVVQAPTTEGRDCRDSQKHLVKLVMLVQRKSGVRADI